MLPVHQSARKQSSLLAKTKDCSIRSSLLFYALVPRRGLEHYMFSTGCRSFFKRAGNLFKSSRNCAPHSFEPGQTKKRALARRAFSQVPRRGLEPPHLAAYPPQGYVYTNFTTWALPLFEVATLCTIGLNISTFVWAPVFWVTDEVAETIMDIGV